MTDVPGSKNASIDAAAAQAAHDVLSALYPSRRAIYDQELAQSLEGIDGNRARQGIRVGSICAAEISAKRSNDGSMRRRMPCFLPPTPGNWQELFQGPYPGFAVFTD